MITHKSDVAIQQRVLDELAEDSRVERAEVGVEVDNSVVTLTGIVPSWAEKLAAEEAAHRVAGVLDVANDLFVKPRHASRPSDTEIAANIRQLLLRNVLVPEDKIHTTVRDGIVSVFGTVDLASERAEVERSIRAIDGVCGIDNRIRLSAS